MQQNELFKLTRYMPEIEEYNNSLNSLAERWNLLTLLGQMSNIGMDMSDTREAFQHLTEQLLVKLGDERLKKLTSEMHSKAQVAVDIVIRNLFERTADIGFLATDDDVREFLEHTLLNNNDNDEYRIKKNDLKKALIKRFDEYVTKYSVYHNIVLLKPNGEILVQLNQNSKIIKSECSLIDQVLSTTGDYVEYYDYCDIDNSKNKSLIYAYKVRKNNDASSETLGVLALFFKFEDEMQGVFKNLLEADDWLNILLLNESGEVIASSDEYHIPLGAKMQKAIDSEFKIVRFAGREYLCKTCKTKGYQGFFGLDWLGHVMVPLQYAFATSTESKLPKLNDSILNSVMRNSNLFGDELITIPKEAEKIQRELDVTVWNGNVQIANTKSGDNSFSKSLLNEISKTGLKTKTIFEDSIGNLNNTVISSILNDVIFLAKLAIDIMDRNLYERANDCRWWALTTFFRNSLKNSTCEQNKISEILAYINNLYTVYTNLFIYDRNGVVIAVSNDSEKYLVGSKLNYEWASNTLSMKNSQTYSVSKFEKTPLYANKHTYIYGSCITDIDDQNSIIGGIGIVFDSEPQFRDILLDTLPKNTQGEIASNYFALFCDTEKTIISSTNSKFSVGHKLDINDNFFSLNHGQSYADIIEYDHKYYSVGSSASKGYREYKVKDNYENDVIAIIFAEIATVEQEMPVKQERKNKTYSYSKPQAQEPTTDISTFFVGDEIYGIESEFVISSLNNQPLTKIIGSNDFFMGVISYLGKTIGVVALHTLITGEKFVYDHTKYGVIILKMVEDEKTNYIGIAVDSIYDSPEIPNRSIQKYASSLLGTNILTKAIVKPEEDINKSQMLSILDVHAIYKKMVNHVPTQDLKMIK
jgi:chemotaxis signal transduction protein